MEGWALGIEAQSDVQNNASFPEHTATRCRLSELAIGISPLGVQHDGLGKGPISLVIALAAVEEMSQVIPVLRGIRPQAHCLVIVLFCGSDVAELLLRSRQVREHLCRMRSELQD